MSDDKTGESGESLWGSIGGKTEVAALAIKVSRQDQLLRVVKLEPDVTYIGRMPENHIVLDDPKASRSHARIFRQGEKCVVEDQASENGIKVNGKRVTRHALRLGDKVVIGAHTLELVQASRSEAETAARHELLEHAEEEEWRMDRTVSITSERIQALHLARMEQKEAKKGAAGPKAPTLELKLQLGERAIEKKIVFEKGKKREAGRPDQMEIRIEIGPWILEKKVTL